MIEFIFVPSRSNKQRKCVYSSGDFYAMVNHLEFRFFFIIFNLILWLYRVRSITLLSSILKKNSHRIFYVTRSLNAASILNHLYPTCHCVGALYTILATTMVVIIIIDVAVVVCFLRCLRSSVLCVHVFAVGCLTLHTPNRIHRRIRLNFHILYSIVRCRFNGSNNCSLAVWNQFYFVFGLWCTHQPHANLVFFVCWKHKNRLAKSLCFTIFVSCVQFLSGQIHINVSRSVPVNEFLLSNFEINN